jgi:hypothetical protein
VAAVNLDADEFRYSEYGDPGALPLVLVTIEGAGHRVHQARPGEFLDAVRPFLRKIRGTTSFQVTSQGFWPFKARRRRPRCWDSVRDGVVTKG